MANMFAKLISTRLHEVNSWLDIASEDWADDSTRNWAIDVASDEMAKVIDDLTVLKSATKAGVVALVGMKVASEYEKTKDRLNEYLNK